MDWMLVFYNDGKSSIAVRADSPGAAATAAARDHGVTGRVVVRASRGITPWAFDVDADGTVWHKGRAS